MSKPVLTLLSCFGRADASVSVAKAILMQHMPGAAIADITHSVPHNDLQQAAYFLLSAYRYFPAGTVHLILVDIFTGEPPRMLLGLKDGFFFIAPDNGILPLAFVREPIDIRLCFEFSTSFSFSDWMRHAARVAEAIQAGDVTHFPVHTVANIPRLLQPKTARDGIDCNILYIDRFGNVVLDITKQEFDTLVSNKQFRIKLMRTDDITTVSNNYNDVPHMKPLCRFNAAGFLEIAYNHGKAATALGLSAHNEASLRYRTIKIFTSGV